MKSIQEMDAIIKDADLLLKEWQEVFKSLDSNEHADWRKVNIAKANLKIKIDKYYNRNPLKGKTWHK